MGQWDQDISEKKSQLMNSIQKLRSKNLSLKPKYQTCFRYIDKALFKLYDNIIELKSLIRKNELTWEEFNVLQDILQTQIPNYCDLTCEIVSNNLGSIAYNLEKLYSTEYYHPHPRHFKGASAFYRLNKNELFTILNLCVIMTTEDHLERHEDESKLERIFLTLCSAIALLNNFFDKFQATIFDKGFGFKDLINLINILPSPSTSSIVLKISHDLTELAQKQSGKKEKFKVTSSLGLMRKEMIPLSNLIEKFEKNIQYYITEI